jgi:hypothetical protein
LGAGGIGAIFVEADEAGGDSLRLTKPVIHITLIKSNGRLPWLIVDALDFLCRGLLSDVV